MYENKKNTVHLITTPWCSPPPRWMPVANILWTIPIFKVYWEPQGRNGLERIDPHVTFSLQMHPSEEREFRMSNICLAFFVLNVWLKSAVYCIIKFLYSFPFITCNDRSTKLIEKYWFVLYWIQFKPKPNLTAFVLPLTAYSMFILTNFYKVPPIIEVMQYFYVKLYIITTPYISQFYEKWLLALYLHKIFAGNNRLVIRIFFVTICDEPWPYFSLWVSTEFMRDPKAIKYLARKWRGKSQCICSLAARWNPLQTFARCNIISL